MVSEPFHVKTHKNWRSTCIIFFSQLQMVFIYLCLVTMVTYFPAAYTSAVSKKFIPLSKARVRSSSAVCKMYKIIHLLNIVTNKNSSRGTTILKLIYRMYLGGLTVHFHFSYNFFVFRTQKSRLKIWDIFFPRKFLTNLQQ